MTRLDEIEAAADALPVEQKRELLLFLAARLREGVELPEPRKLSREQISKWIAEDEADFKKLNQNK
jgi:hypothetical protein